MLEPPIPHTSVNHVSCVVTDEVYVPSENPQYVSWGDHETVTDIIASKIFLPVFISGLSGNGKTIMVEQACAKLQREFVRVQISPETDEDDLIGGFRLLNGETVFQKGPVIKAMEAGALLLIDEIDRGSNKLMCLQGVLEGTPVLLKKTGQVVIPKAGFSIIATANTKGRGSDDGKFNAATVLDEAFLERFVTTIEQSYPPEAIEKKIVVAHMEKFNCVDLEFADRLCAWSSTIHKTYADQGVDEIVSTRRLCHIVKMFSIFRERLRSINACVTRYEPDVKAAFLDLYSKIDASAEAEKKEAEEKKKRAVIAAEAARRIAPHPSLASTTNPFRNVPTSKTPQAPSSSVKRAAAGLDPELLKIMSKIASGGNLKNSDRDDMTDVINYSLRA